MVPIKYPGVTFSMEYLINEQGEIYSPFKKELMIPQISKYGYANIYLMLDTKERKQFKVHRLVMNTFKPIENSELLQVNHIDGNKLNNNLKNLEWCTRSENMKHAFKNKLQVIDGDKNPNHKLTKNQVIEICERLAKKESVASIAKDYPMVAKISITNIKRKYTWKDITSQYKF